MRFAGTHLIQVSGGDSEQLHFAYTVISGCSAVSTYGVKMAVQSGFPVAVVQSAAKVRTALVASDQAPAEEHHLIRSTFELLTKLHALTLSSLNESAKRNYIRTWLGVALLLRVIFEVVFLVLG